MKAGKPSMALNVGLTDTIEAATRGVLLKGVLKNFAQFTRKHRYWSMFLIKLEASGL